MANKQNDGNSVDTPQENAPNVDALQNAVNEAAARVDEAQAEMDAAVKAQDSPAIIAAVDKLKAAQKNRENADKKLQAATWEQRAQEREALANTLHDQIYRFVEENMDVGSARNLGITGVGIVFGEDGTVTITPQTNRPATSGRGRAKSTNGRTGAKGNWVLNGTEYTSRQLLDTFGGQDGVDAIYKVDNFKELGYANSPGFDAPVKKLARTMGWNGDNEDRTLHHEPA